MTDDDLKRVSLDYGKQRRVKIKKRWIAFVIFAIIATIFGIFCKPIYQPYIDQTRHLRDQAKISHIVLSPETVIYTEDAKLISQLAGLADYRLKVPRASDESKGLPTAYERVYSNISFEAFSVGGATVSQFQLNGTFDCLRTSHGGIDWIVCLDQVNPWAEPDGRRKVNFTQASYTIASWKPGSRGRSVSTMSKQILLEKSDVLTLFAPQPNTQSADQIDVRYELNGVGGELKGIVKDSGHVDFSVTSGPAKIVTWDSK